MPYFFVFCTSNFGFIQEKLFLAIFLNLFFDTFRIAVPIYIRYPVLGNIEIKGGKLILSSNPKKRLKKGKKLIIKNIDNAVVHKADSFQDPIEAVISFKDIPHHEPENNIPMEVQQQIYTQFMRKHCTKWLNEKIPALEGRTPVQAVKTEDGRRKVVELLKSFENIEEHNKREGRPFYDLSWMWGSLSLEREL